MSRRFPIELTAIARSQHGLVTDQQLADLGITYWTLRTWLRDGVLVRLHRGVLASPLTEATFERRCLAATMAIGDIAISGPTAGRLHRLRRMPTDDIHAVCPRMGVTLAGVVIHASNGLAPGDIELVDGIPTLRPTRLAADLGRHLSDDDLESVIEQMLDRRLTTMPALFAMARRLQARGRDGMARFVRVINGRPAWQRPAGSEIEMRFLDALAEAGVELVRQLRLPLPDGGLAVLDAAVPACRIAIEVDHVTWHGGRLESEADKARDRQLLQMKWTTIRVTDADVRDRFASTVREVAAIIGAAA